MKAPRDLVVQLTKLVDEHGINGAKKITGLGREPIIRIVGGLDVQAGTVALLRAGLSQSRKASNLSSRSAA